ncbi:hypothetical protein RclHR1_30030001 [Rhizophagus clarus]|uniref:Uncharacterized protein n=1 Tax=Rhizophagus clarus TaxID=94130 RepID=A0A2Z6R620_9GLOM|nr:hypothetical protein RclHR1_30030001 [Rhizophagus clarus]
MQSVVMPNLSSNSTLKPDAKSFMSKIKKVKTTESDPDATHIITGYHLNPSLGQYVHNILVYDIPASGTMLNFLNI